MTLRLGRILAVGAVLATWVVAGSVQAENWADGLFAEHGVDFGTVPRGAKVRHSFLLSNRFNEPITILDVRASCGCTTGQASVALVPPGGSAVIEAQMDTRNFVGIKATTLTVTVITASGQQGEARFAVQSYILPDIVLNPGSVDFGVVSKGQVPEQVVTIERLGAPGWRFTKIIASDALCKVVEAKLVESYRNAQGVGYTMTVRLKPEASAGVLRDEIRLLSNDPQSPSVPVLVTAQVQGSLSATPAVLALGSISSTAGAQGRYLVRGTQPFHIIAVEGNGDGFTLAAPMDPQAKTLHVLTLTYHPEQGSTRGDLRRAFRVVTDLPGEAPLTVNAMAHVAP